jgi:hypothetical protein
MEIDFASLQEASKRGTDVYNKNYGPKESHIINECKQLKQLYISMMNTQFAKEVEQAKQHIFIAEPFHAKAIGGKYWSENVVFMQDACANDFTEDFLKEVEQKLNVQHKFMPCYSPNFKMFSFSLVKKYN